jgi:zinc transport system ATP-binding protein
VRTRDLGFAYPRGPEVLHDINLSIEAGEFVGVAGPNGGGKTTLVRLMVGLERPSSGTIEVFGASPAEAQRQAKIGYLPQRADLGIDAPITVAELVTAGRTPRAGLLRPLGDTDRAAIEAAIHRVGLGEHARRAIRSLSGGQRQRAFIAKALAGDPELLVLDEPTAGVDAEAQESLAGLLDSLRRDLAVTVLYVSHEFGAIEPYVERLVVVREKVVFDGPPSLLPDTWHDPSHVHDAHVH